MKTHYAKASTTMLYKLAEETGLKPTKKNMIPVLYLADRISLLETGRTITRDEYLLVDGKLSMSVCERVLPSTRPTKKEFELASYHLSESDLDAMTKAAKEIKNGFDIYSLPEFQVCKEEITPKDIVVNAGLDKETTKGLLETLEFETFCERIFQ